MFFVFWGFTIEKALTFPTANYHIQRLYYTRFLYLSIFLEFFGVRRPAHGIHFLGKSYELYRDRCLELWGIRYQDIEVYIDQRYNPFRLSRVTDKSGGSQASNPAGIEST